MSKPLRRVLVALATIVLAGCPLFPYRGVSSGGSSYVRASVEIIVRPADPLPSEDIKQRHAGQRLEGDYRLVAEKSGSVTSVKVLRSIPDCDDFVVDRLHHWRLTTSGESTLRVAVVFAAPLPPGQYRGMPELQFNALIISRVAPSPSRGRNGAGSYMVYVEPDGKVSRVDVIQSSGNADEVTRATLAQWRFDPPLERIRGIVRMIVDLKR